MNFLEIKWIRNQDINRKQWDECIAHSEYAVAYAFSWYLDRICTQWDALVAGDYLYMMPLVNRRKFGISYIYQPFFTQQSGIFSEEIITEEIIRLFFESIPEKFRLIEMNLNLGNGAIANIFEAKANTTYHLSLQPELEVIRTGFNANTRRNIQKAIQNRVAVSNSTDIQSFIKFTSANLKDKAPEVKAQHFAVLRELIQFALTNGYGQLLVAANDQKKWLSAVFFVQTAESAIYLAASSSEEGIRKSSMFLLIDTFIQAHAGESLVLDFEGSNIQGIARFYAGFGAMPQIYYTVHQNRLPWLIRFLK
jgi:hypothetical protein